MLAFFDCCLAQALSTPRCQPAFADRAQQGGPYPIALLVVVGGVVVIVIVDHQLHLPRLNSVAYMIAMCRQCRQCCRGTLRWVTGQHRALRGQLCLFGESDANMVVACVCVTSTTMLCIYVYTYSFQVWRWARSR